MTFAKKLSLCFPSPLPWPFSPGTRRKSEIHSAARGADWRSLLPAGQYTIALSMNGSTTAMIMPADHKGAAIFALPVSTDVYADCAASSVSMKRDGADWSVRSICFAEPQVALYFPAPAAKTAVASIAPAPAAMTGR